MKYNRKYDSFPKALKKELVVTGGSVLLLFVILIILISFVWGRGIVMQAKDRYKHELNTIASSLSSMIVTTESHVYRMKAQLERKLPASTRKLTEPAPFDSDSTVPFALFQYSAARSDSSVCIAEALSLSDVAYSAHATDSTYQWSYFYDAAETYSILYPKAFSKDIQAATNTSNPDSMLSAIFNAGGTFPVKMVSPKNNPKGKLLWTVPYPDAGGSGVLVSILAPVIQKGKFVGVVGADITLKKILTFITSQKTGIMRVIVTDGEGKIIVSTALSKDRTAQFVRYSEKLPVNGWKITGEIEQGAFLRSIAYELAMPLGIILISIVAFIVLGLLFLRRFVNPSLALAGFVATSGENDQPQTPEAIPPVWRQFFQQVIDGLNERSKLTDQLHQSQKMEAIGQLAGGIAHDFNNALGGIIGATELLKMGNLSLAEQDEFYDLILTAGERAGDLTQKLLLFSRKGSKVSTAVDCLKIAEDTVSLLTHTINKNISILMENRANYAVIIGDDALLQNALMNMGINASHAMPSGGELTFTLENLRLDEEYCEISPFDIKPGNYLEIAIRDTGCGMTPETQSHIFEPFFTTKESGKGTGLGLASVYGTVQEHGGAITVYSEVGSGTVFHLYFPVTMETAATANSSEDIMAGTGTVLVIDDEELIRITASALLVSLGYKVILATNGLEGVNTFAEIKDEIDLIILDMIMPIMGGREAFLKLREIDPTIPVIIASGFAKEEDMAALKKEGISGFLHKPFRRAELAEMVVQSLTDIDTDGNKGSL